MVWLLRKGLEKALHLKSSQLASSQWGFNQQIWGYNGDTNGCNGNVSIFGE